MNYVVNNSMAKHTVQFTLQSGEYTGHVVMQMGGNCRGLDVLSSFDFAEDYDNRCKNDCELVVHDDGYFSMVLNNGKGSTLEIADAPIEDLNLYVVAMEIIDFQEE